VRSGLVLLTWPDYLSLEGIAEFEAEFDLALELEIVASADELLARMRRPGPAPDLLCPPDYAVRQLQTERLLLTVDKRKLPNLSHLAPEFQLGRPHDPKGEVSVIKDWGTTGYLVRTDLVAEPGRSWADFWNLAERHPGRVSLLDSQSEVIGAALKLRGHSYNAEDEPALAEARQELLRLKPTIGYFETGYRPLLESGQVVLALGWNGDAASLKAAGLSLAYVIPEEGSQIWEIDWAIAAGAPNPAEAHNFIDYQLRPEVAAREAAFTRYATPNASAFEQLDPRIRTDPGTYPSEEVMARLEYGMPLTPTGARRRAVLWAEIRGHPRPG
jgi:spermidine/putrescine transport system substrate-binding protein